MTKNTEDDGALTLEKLKQAFEQLNKPTPQQQYNPFAPWEDQAMIWELLGRKEKEEAERQKQKEYEAQYQRMQEQARKQAVHDKLAKMGAEILAALPIGFCDEIQLTPAQYKAVVTYLHNDALQFGRYGFGFNQTYTYKGVPLKEIKK